MQPRPRVPVPSTAPPPHRRKVPIPAQDSDACRPAAPTTRLPSDRRTPHDQDYGPHLRPAVRRRNPAAPGHRASALRSRSQPPKPSRPVPVPARQRRVLPHCRAEITDSPGPSPHPPHSHPPVDPVSRVWVNALEKQPSSPGPHTRPIQLPRTSPAPQAPHTPLQTLTRNRDATFRIRPEVAARRPLPTIGGARRTRPDIPP